MSARVDSTPTAPARSWPCDVVLRRGPATPLSATLHCLRKVDGLTYGARGCAVETGLDLVNVPGVDGHTRSIDSEDDLSDVLAARELFLGDGDVFQGVLAGDHGVDGGAACGVGQ